eukprot:COSAG06_NODE_22990_length_706_cov_1.028007_1_plen_168_part_10
MRCSDPTLSPQLEFDSFATEGAFDYLYLYYDYVNSPSPDATLHGTDLPEPQFSFTSTAIARFVSDGFVGHNGFSAAFTCIDASALDPPPPSACTTGLELEYPACLDTNSCAFGQAGYDMALECSWTLACSDDALSPQVTLTMLATEGDYDFVDLYFSDSMVPNPDVRL